MKKVAEPIERDEAQVLEDIDAQRAALADAQRETGELQRRRCEMLVSASVDAVHEIDTVIGRAATKVEVAGAKVNALEAELERFYAAERDAQTAADFERARQLAEEARQLIVRDYAKAAREIAETLAKLASLETELRALRARLPTHIGELQIEATLGQRVVLPAITPVDAAFWPTQPRLQTINEIYARN
jgi:DNA repair exonuclease SbcCD ATPase subunit